ncbi:hypothetical protein NC651_013729 [Populus alba x Populus x berolinensis]|nr:hypothetical protein NC651_013729 [Populus alba x Populus x berolinensis]
MKPSQLLGFHLSRLLWLGESPVRSLGLLWHWHPCG